jgi:hypothetical protein
MATSIAAVVVAFVGVIAPPTASPARAAAIPTPNAHWSFDEGAGTAAADSAGDADLALTAASWVSDGAYGSGLHLDGSTSQADGSASGLHPGPLTIALWVRADLAHPPVDGAAILEMGGRAACGDPTWAFTVAGEGFEFSWTDTVSSTFRTIEGTSRAGIDLWDGGWHHIAVSGSDAPFTYMSTRTDGRLGGSTEWSPTYDYTGLASDTIAVGHDVNGCDAAARYQGDIDDVRIYDSALGPEEIGALMPSIPTSVTTVGPSTGVAFDSICFDTEVAPDPGQGDLTYTITSSVGPDRVIGPPQTLPFRNPVTMCLSIEAGVHTITASFGHGLPFAPSSGAPVAFTLAKRATILDLAGNTQQLSSAPLELGARIDSSPETPRSGTVAFFDTTGGGHVALGSAPVDDQGLAALTIPARPVGTYAFSAEYSGAADYLASSGTTDVEVFQDAVAGPVIIDSGAPYTNDPLVHLDLPTAGASAVSVSNSGTLWQVFDPPQLSVDGWDLTALATGGQPGDGTKTVHAIMVNQFNTPSPEITASIVLDRTAPLVGTPKAALGTGSVMGTSGPTVVVSWTGSDGLSGMAGYDVQQSIDGGPYAVIAAHQPAKSLHRTLLSGHRYVFRVRGIDRAGNVGAWRTASSVKLSVFQSASTVRYQGTWHTTRSASYLKGSAEYATVAGARATLTFKGRSVAWVARTGKTEGWATVYIDGVRAARVNLGAASTHYRVVVFSRTWSSVKTHTISIRVEGTRGHPRIDLDGLVVGS